MVKRARGIARTPGTQSGSTRPAPHRDRSSVGSLNRNPRESPSCATCASGYCRRILGACRIDPTLPALHPATNTRRGRHPLEHPLERGGRVDVPAVVDGDRAAAGPVGADGVTGEDVARARGDQQHRPATERVLRVVQVQHPGSVRGVVGRVHVVVEQRRPGSAGAVVPAATTTLEEHQQPVGIADASPERKPPPTPTPGTTPRLDPAPAPRGGGRARAGARRARVTGTWPRGRPPAPPRGQP